MICSTLSTLIGFTCYPLSDDGSIAMIDAPFAFPDGDSIPIYVENAGGQIRFFDDGGAILHLMGRGISLEDKRKTRFIKTLASPYGVSLNDMGELEIFAPAAEAPAAFAKYISAMLSLSRWEHDQEGASTDTSLFIDEVVLCLRAWKPNATIGEGREYAGVSGHIYKMDIEFDGGSALALGTHPAAISAAAKKLLDIRSSTENEGLKVLVVIDDRHEPETAKKEGLILDSVANVMMMSKLERSVASSRHSH